MQEKFHVLILRLTVWKKITGATKEKTSYKKCFKLHKNEIMATVEGWEKKLSEKRTFLTRKKQNNLLMKVLFSEILVWSVKKDSVGMVTKIAEGNDILPKWNVNVSEKKKLKHFVVDVIIKMVK